MPISPSARAFWAASNRGHSPAGLIHSSGTALALTDNRRANPSKRLGVASARTVGPAVPDMWQRKTVAFARHVGAVALTRSLLYLSYLFPPRGGAGVQRSLKFAKYLPHFGWQPLIIANGARASDGVTQMQDKTLLRDLPPNTIIRYTQDQTKLQN